ncbi:MAG TPA: RimK/LysX family protein [Vicinamibacterales bacterium]|nr:RimK/LysX family protein [Vicinamibacterales bacterium]
MQPAEPPTLGWREWLALPVLGIGAIKAKLDTGARSSALCVVAAETFEREGRLHVRFLVRPRRRGGRVIACESPVVGRRPVTDSGGHTSERWFIRTEVVVANQRFETDINLTDRRAMLFPLLLGRTALGGRFRIDPALSYTGAKPESARPRP